MSRILVRTCVVGVFLLVASRGHSATFCDDCWEKMAFDPVSMQFWKDAQCCIAGADCNLSYDPGWSPVHHNVYCEIVWKENRGYVCDKPRDCFREDGGGGAGGSSGTACFVPLSAPCPAECETCERDPFRI